MYHESAQTQMALSVAILAGGRSQRLGAEKATVLLCGEPLLRHVERRLAPLGSDDLMLVLRPGQALPLEGIGRVVRDAAPDRGILAGIAAALKAARHEWVFVTACDMPWVSASLARHQYAQRQGHDAVVPRLAVGLEPLHGLYHRRCLAAMHAAIVAGERRTSRVIRAMNIRYVEKETIQRVDPLGRAFANINTPQDLERAVEWHSSGSCPAREE